MNINKERILEKTKTKISISDFIKEEKKLPKNINIIKTLVATILMILSCSGMVFAKEISKKIYDDFFDFNMDDEDTAVLVSPSVPKTEKKNINKNKQENKTAENPPRKTSQAKQPTFPTDNHPVEDNQKEKENNISDKVEQTGRFSKNSSEDKKAIKRTDIASNKEVSFESKDDTHKK